MPSAAPKACPRPATPAPEDAPRGLPPAKAAYAAWDAEVTAGKGLMSSAQPSTWGPRPGPTPAQAIKIAAKGVPPPSRPTPTPPAPGRPGHAAGATPSAAPPAAPPAQPSTWGPRPCQAPYLLLHFTPPPLPGTRHQQWLALVIASLLSESLREEMVAALLTPTPASPIVPFFDLLDLENALASGALERASLADLCRYLATEMALARQFVGYWAQAPAWRRRLRHNGAVGRHAARMRWLFAVFADHPKEQAVSRFRQVVASATRQG